MEDQQTFPFSFGELLKTHRKRKRLTQKQLAQQLGVHANTISSWELGTYLPDTRGLVLELGRHLALDEQETRQLLEASLTALSPYWLVPLPRNPFFTGREEILEALHTQLHVEHAREGRAGPRPVVYMPPYRSASPESAQRGSACDLQGEQLPQWVRDER